MGVDWTRIHGGFSGGRARSALALAALLTLGAGDLAWAQTSAPSTTAPAAPAPAAAPATAPGPNTGRLSVSAGVDWTSAYFFRGIKQETDDLILQPYGELTLKLVENAGALTSLSLTGGIWNSLHSGATGSDSPTASDPKLWYELDGYFKLSAVLLEDWTASVIYTAYLSPNNVFNSVQEIAVGLAYNDAKLLGPFALNPSVLIAFEFDGQADAGADKGIYAQIGIAPAYTFLADSAYPLTLCRAPRRGPEPQRLLRVRHRLGRHLRVLLGRRHPVRAARVHPARVRQVAGQGRRPGALPRRQPEGRQRRRRGPGHRHPRPGLQRTEPAGT